MTVEVNFLAVFLAMISSMIIGTIWYAKPVFGDLWMKMVGMNEQKASKGAGRAIVGTIIVSFVTAYVLAYFAFLSHNFLANSFLQDALVASFWLWLGFTAARFVTHDLFEQRQWKLTLLNVSHEFITIMTMGLIIGLLEP